MRCFLCVRMFSLSVTLVLWCSTLQAASKQSDVMHHACSVDADCPLWTACRNSSCVCREELGHKNAITCDRETLQLAVLRCHCVTLDPETSELIEGNCIQNCETTSEKFIKQYLHLPTNVSQLNYFMCEKTWNRTGRLCGKCLPGHYPLAYSYDMKCVQCPAGNTNLWKYFLVAFGPLTIFYFLVLFLKINATSSYLHGYLIFSQTIGTPTIARHVVMYNLAHPDTTAIIQTIATMYTMWNLDFFRILDLNICLDVSSLTILALDYAVAVYPLLLTVISYFMIELHARNVRIVVILWKPFYCLLILFRRNWDSRTTVIDAYATFFVLSYIKIAYISADLLIPVRVHSLNNDSVTWVLYYDATVDYFGREHLPYAILAIVCLVLLIIPTMVLFLYQFSCFQKILACSRIQSHILTALMDSFQGGYKDGTEPGTRDHRWFAGVPLAGRALILLIYAVILDGSFMPLEVIVSVCIMLLLAYMQPYKKHLLKYMKSDITFWGLIAMLFAIDAAATYTSLKPITLTRVVRYLRIIATLIPLLCMICITAYYVISRMRRVKELVSRLKAWRRGYLNIEMDFAESLPDRVMNPEHYNQQYLQEPMGHDDVTQTCDADTY